jgi:DNA gyrase/topoisomerase IV subunit B
MKVLRKATSTEIKSLPRFSGAARGFNIRYGKICVTSDFDVDGRRKPT